MRDLGIGYLASPSFNGHSVVIQWSLVKLRPPAQRASGPAGLKFETGCTMQDARCRMYDARYRILFLSGETGYWVLGTECK